jgi:transcriptional regulator with XRE-family HTH domain
MENEHMRCQQQFNGENANAITSMRSAVYGHMPIRYTPLVTIGQSMRAVRLRVLGVSQKELAKRTGVAQDEISRYETGEREPGAAKLRQLRDGTGVPVDQWLGFAEAKPPSPGARASIDDVAKNLTDDADHKLVLDVARTALRRQTSASASPRADAPAPARPVPGKRRRGRSSGSAPAA